MSTRTQISGGMVTAIFLLACDAAFAAPYPQAVLADNPLGYYRMGETSGTTALDATTPAEDGVYQNGVTLGIAGPQAPAYLGFEPTNLGAQFDGVNDRLEITSFTTLNDAAYTFEIWFKENGQVGDLGYVGGRGSGASLAYDAIGLHLGQLIFFDGADVFHPLGPFPTPNAWHHLAYTRSGSTVRVYLNGALVSNLTSTASYGTSDRITVGDRPGDTGAITPFLGSLDELAIYNTALTAEQIFEHFAAPEPSALALTAFALGAMLLRRARGA
jgi:hypothetical protein